MFNLSTYLLSILANKAVLDCARRPILRNEILLGIFNKALETMGPNLVPHKFRTGIIGDWDLKSDTVFCIFVFYFRILKIISVPSSIIVIFLVLFKD
jgi:hypothetical protein